MFAGLPSRSAGLCQACIIEPDSANNSWFLWDPSEIAVLAEDWTSLSERAEGYQTLLLEDERQLPS